MSCSMIEKISLGVSWLALTVNFSMIVLNWRTMKSLKRTQDSYFEKLGGLK